MTKITKNDKIIDIFELDCSENHEKLRKITKNDKIIYIFELNCIENHEKWWKITKNDKNIDIFELDCSENHGPAVGQPQFLKKTFCQDALCQSHFVKNSCAGFFLTKCIWERGGCWTVERGQLTLPRPDAQDLSNSGPETHLNR